jgi:hypothetical protein
VFRSRGGNNIGEYHGVHVDTQNFYGNDNGDKVNAEINRNTRPAEGP